MNTKREFKGKRAAPSVNFQNLISEPSIKALIIKIYGNIEHRF